MLNTFRAFTNRLGKTFDAAKTSVVFAEDMQLIKNLFTFSVYGGRVQTDVVNVASTPTTPTVFETLKPQYFVGAGNTVEFELFFNCPDFSAGQQIRLAVDSHDVLIINGDNAYSANVSIRAKIALTRDLDDALRGCVVYQIGDAKIDTIYGKISAFDFTIDHPINLFLVGAVDGDVNLVGGWGKVFA